MSENRILYTLGKFVPGWLPVGIEFEHKPGEIRTAVINTALKPAIAVRDAFRGCTDQELDIARDITDGKRQITNEERAAFINKNIDALSLETFQTPRVNAYGGVVVVFPRTGFKEAVENLRSLTPEEVDGRIKKEAQELLKRVNK